MSDYADKILAEAREYFGDSCEIIPEGEVSIHIEPASIGQEQSPNWREILNHPRKLRCEEMPSVQYYRPNPVDQEPTRPEKMKRKYIQEWNFSWFNIVSTPSKSGKSITPFSEAFQNAVGRENVSHIHGLSDYPQAELFFRSYIEWEAFQQYFRRTNPRFTQFLTDIEADVSISQGTDGQIEWRTWSNRGKGIVTLLMGFWGINKHDAIATAGWLLNIDFPAFFQAIASQNQAHREKSQYREDWFPSILPSMDERLDVFRLIDRKDIPDSTGSTIGAFLRYISSSVDFCLSASVIKGFLSIGQVNPNPHFLNQHL